MALKMFDQKEFAKDVLTALANGNRAQIIRHPDGAFTAHEHVGQSSTTTKDGVAIGWAAVDMAPQSLAAYLAENPLAEDIDAFYLSRWYSLPLAMINGCY